MKKASSLAEQVQQAQRTIDSWPEWRKSSLQLEGSDRYSRQNVTLAPSHHKSTVSSVKKK
jgi:hypothetical protein